jgi:hypothetical protein
MQWRSDPQSRSCLYEQRDGAKHDERRVGDHCIDAKALTG